MENGKLRPQDLKCLTLGGAMVDTIAIVENRRIEQLSLRNADTAFLMLEEGRKTEAQEISTYPGGGGVNVAVALARLGLQTQALIKLGQDDRAAFILRALQAEGVDCRHAVQTPAAPTGAAVMVAAHDRNAAIFTFRGANTCLVEADLPPAAFEQDLVYVAGLSNESAACFGPITRLARAAGAFVATNPGIRQISARRGGLLDHLEAVDLLTINRLEADALVPALADEAEASASTPVDPRAASPHGVGPQSGGSLGGREGGEAEAPRLLVSGLASGGFELSVQAFVAALLRQGPRFVAITDGAHGAYLGCKDGLYHAPVAPVEVQGTAGAGDAFGATLAGFLAAQAPPAQALAAASLNAAAVTTRIDTQTGLLGFSDLEAQLKATGGLNRVCFWPS